MDRQTAEPVTRALGFVGIRKRIDSAHGIPAVHSQPGSGTALPLNIPHGTNNAD
jgi:hypothetical protein